jgi:hypothetical protein
VNVAAWDTTITTKIFNAQGHANDWSIPRTGWCCAWVSGRGLTERSRSGEVHWPDLCGHCHTARCTVAFDGIVNTSGADFTAAITVCNRGTIRFNGGTMRFNAGSTLNDSAGGLDIGVCAVGNFIANGGLGGRRS